MRFNFQTPLGDPDRPRRFNHACLAIGDVGIFSVFDPKDD
jgi:hypothetical protein